MRQRVTVFDKCMPEAIEDVVWCVSKIAKAI